MKPYAMETFKGSGCIDVLLTLALTARSVSFTSLPLYVFGEIAAGTEWL
jgi:hypothetical protein